MFIDVPIDFDPFLDGIRVKSIKEVDDELLLDNYIIDFNNTKK